VQLKPWSKVSIIDASHFDAGRRTASIRFRLDDCARTFTARAISGRSWTEITKGIRWRRQQRGAGRSARKGLLFAGIGSSVYVSFNDGDDWQPLQLNLRILRCAILAIHGDDLIVATTAARSGFLTTSRRCGSKRRHRERDCASFCAARTIRFRWNRKIQKRRFHRKFPPEKNPPDGAITITTSHPVRPTGDTEIFDEQQHFGAPLFQCGQARSRWKKPRPSIYSDVLGAPDEILSAVAGMHRSPGTCTTTPGISRARNFQFPQSCTTRQKYPSSVDRARELHREAYSGWKSYSQR